MVSKHARTWHIHFGIKVLCHANWETHREKRRVRWVKSSIRCPIYGFHSTPAVAAQQEEALRRILKLRKGKQWCICYVSLG